MNSRTNLLVVLAILLTGISAIPCSGETLTIDAEAIDPLVQAYVDGEIVNAISIGVVQGNNSWSRHFGTLSKRRLTNTDFGKRLATGRRGT